MLNLIDFSILDFIQANIKNPVLDQIIPFITSLGNGGVIWIIVAIIFLITRRYRPYGIMLGAVLLLGVIAGDVILKPLIGRVRPCNVNTAVELLIERPMSFSFPSGHTMSSFGAAAVIWAADRRFGISALILAVLIAFSRLYLYVHYPSDIAGGIVFGLAVAMGVIALFKQLPWWKRRNISVAQGDQEG